MLKDIVENKRLKLKAVIGFWPAHGDGDDVIVYNDEKKEEIARFYGIRQQAEKVTNEPYVAYGDFVAPESSKIDDFMGGFAVACFGAEEMASKFEKDLDDYNAIMVKVWMELYIYLSQLLLPFRFYLFI